MKNLYKTGLEKVSENIGKRERKRDPEWSPKVYRNSIKIDKYYIEKAGQRYINLLV